MEGEGRGWGWVMKGAGMKKGSHEESVALHVLVDGMIIDA